MAMIFQFRRPDDDTPDRKPQVSAPERPQQSAEIIIFPGVRIERRIDDNESHVDQSPAKGKLGSPATRD